MKAWTLAMGIGAAAGAIAVMMLPRENSVRKMAYQAAEKVEDAMTTAANKIADQITG